MRNMTVSFPELAFVAATRGMAGAGIGLLASSHIEPRHRTKVGLALLAIGLLTTIPIAFSVFRRSRYELADY